MEMFRASLRGGFQKASRTGSTLPVLQGPESHSGTCRMAQLISVMAVPIVANGPLRSWRLDVSRGWSERCYVMSLGKPHKSY